LDQGYFSGIRAFFLLACEEVLSHDPMILGTGAEYQRAVVILGMSTFSTAGDI